MAEQDLSKLQIDRGAKSFGTKRRPRWVKWTAGAAVAIGIAVLAAFRSATSPVTVDTANVTSAFPDRKSVV